MGWETDWSWKYKRPALIHWKIIQIYLKCAKAVKKRELLGLLKTGPIVCPEISVRNCHYSLPNSPEDRCSHILRGGSLVSHKTKLAVNQQHVVDISVKDRRFDSKRVHICVLRCCLRSTVIVLSQLSYKFGLTPLRLNMPVIIINYFLTLFYNEISYGICGRQDGRRRLCERVDRGWSGYQTEHSGWLCCPCRVVTTKMFSSF